MFTALGTKNSEQTSNILNEHYNQLSQSEKLMIHRYLNSKKDTMVLDIDTGSYSASDKSSQLVRRIQNTYVNEAHKPSDIGVYVGGPTSEGIDTNRVISQGLIPVIVMMLFIGYIILLFTFKSVFLPLKAIIMNLLSIGASYGILVYVFALGHGASFFHIDANGYIQNFVPVLLVALLFGLSTDLMKYCF
ncbi:MMPL family transporter [Terrilactibacillus sp. S3-3]|nr:MMPL family transporter [Terrilactibacillus sp. S3-3]